MNVFQELNADAAEVIGLFPTLMGDVPANFDYPIKVPKLGARDYRLFFRVY